MTDILALAAAAVFGIVLTAVSVVWGRHDDRSVARRREKSLASFSDNNNGNGERDEEESQ
jgi:cell division protein FtsL